MAKNKPKKQSTDVSSEKKWTVMNPSDEPHLTSNEKTQPIRWTERSTGAQPIRWTERSTGALVAAGSPWPFSGMLNSGCLSPWQAGTIPRHETLT